MTTLTHTGTLGNSFDLFCLISLAELSSSIAPQFGQRVIQSLVVYLQLGQVDICVSVQRCGRLPDGFLVRCIFRILCKTPWVFDLSYEGLSRNPYSKKGLTRKLKHCEIDLQAQKIHILYPIYLFRTRLTYLPRYTPPIDDTIQRTPGCFKNLMNI